jgi:TetR/AcrR family transcriptional regulator, regulator of cefoperazone and chloramphenicol sensitivity
MASRPEASSDLTGYARIRNAALECFARDGFEASSVRAIARAAGVSPGLVQHHFPTKALLRDAVNVHVVALAAAPFADLPLPAADADPFEELGERITRLLSEHPDALRYTARATLEGDEAALELFGAFVAIARSQWDALAREGRLRADLDLDWAALHPVIFNLGVVLFREAIERHLAEPLFSAQGLERLNVAMTTLQRLGTSSR